MRPHSIGLLPGLLSLSVGLWTSACGPSDATLAPVGRPRYAGPSEVSFGSTGATVTLRLDSFGMRIANEAGRVVLETAGDAAHVAGDDAHAYGALGATRHETVLKPGLVEGWDHVEGGDAAWLHGTAVASATFTASSAALDLFDPADEATTLHLEIAALGPEVRVDARVSVEAAPAGPLFGEDKGPLNQMGQSFALAPDEHFFGLGERYLSVDHRGRHYECWVEEGGVGQGEKAPPGPTNPSPNGPGMTHVPIPFLLSTKGYGLWIDSTYRTGFSLGADAVGLSRIYAAEPALRYRVLVHDDPRDTLAHYTALTGRAHLPAPWVFGPRRRVDRGSMALGVPEIDALRAHGVPTTMVDDTTHFLPIRSEAGQEAALSDWTAEAHGKGFKAIAYFNPHVSVNDPRAAELAAYGREHGYFVKLADGTEFDTFLVSSGPQTVATIDLTNPDAVAWYQTLLGRALDLGYDGWMLDFGEYLPQAALLHDGRTGWEAHNAFPVLYQQVTYDYLRERRGDDFMFFARAGFTGTQAHVPIVWSGDPAASFDDAKGLPANVRAGINAGLSGMPYWGSDISGYTCLHDSADKELYLRWAEFGALSPDMHDENACAQAPPGAPPKWTLWSDAETIEVYGRYARLHTRLLPYLYAAAKEAADSGLPIMRHPVLVHPDAPEAVAVEHEYYYGPSLYAAPVVRRGAVTRDLWLPPGRWIDWWTSEPLTGGKAVTRDAPLDVVPLFLRSGGIVAMLDASIETLAPESSPTVIGPGDVAGVLDLRAAIDPGATHARAALADGTVLELELEAGAGSITLPAGVLLAASDADLAACERCGKLDVLPGGVTRVRITSASSGEETLKAGSLTLHHHAPAPLRARWDVAVLGS